MIYIVFIRLLFLWNDVLNWESSLWVRSCFSSRACAPFRYAPVPQIVLANRCCFCFSFFGLDSRSSWGFSSVFQRKEYVVLVVKMPAFSGFLLIFSRSAWNNNRFLSDDLLLALEVSFLIDISCCLTICIISIFIVVSSSASSRGSKTWLLSDWAITSTIFSVCSTFRMNSWNIWETISESRLSNICLLISPSSSCAFLKRWWKSLTVLFMLCLLFPNFDFLVSVVFIFVALYMFCSYWGVGSYM